MKDVLHLLESEREAERRFVAETPGERDFPKGWSAGLLMAHIAAWRERLRGSLIEASRGEPASATAMAPMAVVPHQPGLLATALPEEARSGAAAQIRRGVRNLAAPQR